MEGEAVGGCSVLGASGVGAGAGVASVTTRVGTVVVVTVLVGRRALGTSAGDTRFEVIALRRRKRGVPFGALADALITSRKAIQMAGSIAGSVVVVTVSLVGGGTDVGS
jgi:hypothetical protein